MSRHPIIGLWRAAALGGIRMLGTTPALAQQRSLPVAATPPTPGTPPMSFWSAAGPQAASIDSLLWGLIWLSVAVVAIIAALVVGGIVVRGRGHREVATTPVERSGKGTSLIYAGVGISTIVLIIYTGWTVATMAGIARPPVPAAFTIDVVAHQWWWEFRYEDPASGADFTTANEIHVPVGAPVHFTLRTADVIHSFWVPALGGKTDVIPGRINQMWLEAGKPGIYRGQCSEYCGLQHAQMALRVIADRPDDFAAWRQNQLAGAPAPTTASTQAGLATFVQRCAACHTIRGTAAHGAKGPDLSHLMSRTTIAAGMLANTPGNLGGWIADPQGIKPGAKMPAVALSGPELATLQTYLATLN